MELIVNPIERRIAVHDTMDELRKRLFIVFDGILDKTASAQEVDEAVKLSVTIMDTIESESNEQTKQLERAVIEKERLTDAVTVLAETINKAEEVLLESWFIRA